ncbi:MAG: pyridoxine 5'-phosphate synthase [Sphingobacteriales bacterium]|jgi:pyridoxine 5-phosphate synthase|nr:pyridoxine 5'-phosphate synthase [Sphingobacteriales bacterium]
MTRLSVNINKIALLRNARGSNFPNLVQVAQDCERFGAEGITVHPRPDERHIKYQDVYDLKPIVSTEFNIEGYPDARFLEMVLAVRPHQCTLVPDPPGVLTSNAGWDTLTHKMFLADVIAQLHAHNIRVSLFIETNEAMIEGAKEVATDRIEFYTGPYAEQYPHNPKAAVEPYKRSADFATQLGLGLNAGHDLNLMNLAYLKSHIANLQEVSIGHALITDALYYGLQNTIALYKKCLV